MFKNSIFLIIQTLFVLQLYAQVPTPAKEQTKPMILTGGTAHLGNGKVIENAAVGFERGKITIVADAAKLQIDKSKFEVIDVTGKHLYPGFIAPNTTLGLRDIDQVRATLDFDEVGDIIPNVRTIIAYNTDSEIIPTVRSNGVLLAQPTPKGGLISGTSSIVELDGWNWEDAAYRIDDGIHLQWPKMFTSSGWWAEPGPIKKNKKRGMQLAKLEKFFQDAVSYYKSRHDMSSGVNLKLESMKGLFDGKKTLFMHTNYSKEIIESIKFAKKYGVKKIVIVGGKDAWMVADFLKQMDIAVILFRIHSLPPNKDDDIDLSYKMPYILHQKGVLFCLNYMGGMEAMGQRNLPFIAGTAAAYGLTKEEALMLITSNTAKILGIDKRVGTIEEGKDATLIVSTGDVLDIRTNNIEYAFIRGKKIDLDNKQKRLYRKFKEKYIK
ncbi:MAG: amidohydrolase family protein [Cytophagales bacterium]|nr:amidohydrolase family protein [Cytophagales bacterium]